MTQVDRRKDQLLTPSQREWLHVRSYLREHRYELGLAAADEYPDVAKVAGTALLTAPRWLPAEPVPLDRIELDFTPDVPFKGISGTEDSSEHIRPIRPDGIRYPSYSAGDRRPGRALCIRESRHI